MKPKDHTFKNNIGWTTEHDQICQTFLNEKKAGKEKEWLDDYYIQYIYDLVNKLIEPLLCKYSDWIYSTGQNDDTLRSDLQVHYYQSFHNFSLDYVIKDWFYFLYQVGKNRIHTCCNFLHKYQSRLSNLTPEDEKYQDMEEADIFDSQTADNIIDQRKQDQLMVDVTYFLDYIRKYYRYNCYNIVSDTFLQLIESGHFDENMIKSRADGRIKKYTIKTRKGQTSISRFLHFYYRKNKELWNLYVQGKEPPIQYENKTRNRTKYNQIPELRPWLQPKRLANKA